MPTENIILTQTIPSLFELCKTIRQAADHAAKEPAAAPAMKENIAAGISAVEEAARQLCPENPPTHTDRKSFSELKGDQLPQFINDWFTNLMGPYLAEQFRRILRDQPQFFLEDAQQIAHWILNQMPLKPDGKRNLLLELGVRCSAWAPEFSWQLMSQVMDTMPPDEQKENFPHWSGGSYQPGLHPQRELKCCPVCGGAGVPYQTALSGRMNDFNTMFLPIKLWMRCQHCGNLYTRYFPAEFLQLGAVPKVLQPTPHRMTVRQARADNLHTWCEILNKIRTYTDGTSLLEVGVGQGYLIAAAQEMGYDVTAVELIEADAQETADLLELPIICGDFLHLEEDRQMDIITMGDVLEHLQHPLDGLKKAHALLKENGILWLSTPNFESGFTHMMKVFDPMWCEPYHITYFSRKGLMSLLEQVGFELLEYTVSERYNGSMELLLRKVS